MFLSILEVSYYNYCVFVMGLFAFAIKWSLLWSLKGWRWDNAGQGEEKNLLPNTFSCYLDKIIVIQKSSKIDLKYLTYIVWAWAGSRSSVFLSFFFKVFFFLFCFAFLREWAHVPMQGWRQKGRGRGTRRFYTEPRAWLQLEPHSLLVICISVGFFSLYIYNI